MPKRAPKKTVRLIHFVLDETGSMSAKKEEAINGYNKFLKELEVADDVDLRFSLTKFDSTHQTLVHDAVSVWDVPEMTEDDYMPGAMTPLLDATANAIKQTQKRAKELGAESAMIISMTDGLENASREMSKETLNQMIKQQEKAGWEFVYLGVSEEAWGNQPIYHGTKAIMHKVKSVRAGYEGMTVTASAYASRATQAESNS